MTITGRGIQALAAAGLLALLSGCVMAGGGHWRPHGEIHHFHDDRPHWVDPGRRHRGHDGHGPHRRHDHGPSHHGGRRR